MDFIRRKFLCPAQKPIKKEIWSILPDELVAQLSLQKVP